MKITWRLRHLSHKFADTTVVGPGLCMEKLNIEGPIWLFSESFY